MESANCSAAALAIGPLLARWLTPRPSLAAGLDAFVVVSVAGLVLTHVLPEAVQAAGLVALVAFGVGLLLPALLHGRDERSSAHHLALLALLAGMGLHALLDELLTR